MTLQKNSSINTSQKNRLSVQISLNGLSFLVSSQNGTPLYFFEKQFQDSRTPEELLLELKNSIEQESNLSQNIENVTIVYSTLNYGIVPSALFDETKASEYLKFNTKILKNDFISHDEVENQNMVCVYVPFVNINNYVFETYGSFQYYHSSTLLLSSFLKAEKHSQNTKVYLHIAKEHFECIVIKNGNLQLCNSYTYKTPEDFIYYVLFCMEQLNLNPDTIDTIVCGAIDKDDELFTILYTYVRNVDFINISFPQLDTESNHQHFLHKIIV